MEAVLSVMKIERMYVNEECMLCASLSCQTLPKGLVMSRRISFVVCLFCCALDIVSWNRAVRVPRHPLNPCWLDNPPLRL